MTEEKGRVTADLPRRLDKDPDHHDYQCRVVQLSAYRRCTCWREVVVLTHFRMFDRSFIRRGP